MESPHTRDTPEFYADSFYSEYIEASECDYSVLKLYLDTDDENLKKLYVDYIQSHNANNDSETGHYNSGFDLFIPNECTISPDQFLQTQMVNLKIQCEMIHCRMYPFITDTDKYTTNYSCNPTGYYLYPRSSMSKMPIMLANHTGIIDSGYRGHILAAVRSLSQSELTIPQYTRLFQICSPNLCRVYVTLVEKEDLSSSVRGTGGFGSTGTAAVKLADV